MRILTLITILAVLTCAASVRAQEEPDLGTEEQRQAGSTLYMDKCAQCHGETGAGDGVGAAYLQPAPRDFTAGVFKVRSTPSGALPTEEDIIEMIREGMPYTGMPDWPTLSESQLTNLMYFIKTFNDDFAGPYGTPETVEIPDPPSFSQESAERGRAVYEENQCYDCHGDAGRGDGSSAPTLETQWGRHIRPADMTKRWTFVGGTSREDIYRTFTTGMDGSPMPSYDIAEEDRWALVDYVYSLSRDNPNYATMLVARGLTEPLDIEQGPELFEQAETAYFPVVGQVIEEGREFSPGTDGIEVKAVYNQDDIAFMLSWHTMTPDTTGTNSPTMDVPPLAQRDTIRVTPAATENPTPEYSDAVALQLPSDSLEGTVKPYFLFGDSEHAVDLWFADLGGSAAEHFTARGSGSIQPGSQELSMYSEYNDGRWTVIFKRSRTVEGGVALDEGGFAPVAFSVWDGFNHERGNRRGITSWYSMYLSPIEQQSAFVPMAGYGLLTLLVELGLIYAVRRKYQAEPVEAS